MAVDLTQEFHALVLEHGGGGGGGGTTTKRSKPAAAFSSQSRLLASSLLRVRTLVDDVSSSYLDFASPQGMTPVQRDSIDSLIAEALAKAENQLASLAYSTTSAQGKGQNAHDHERGVGYLLLDQIRTIQDDMVGLQGARQRHSMSKSDRLCPSLSLLAPSEAMPLYDYDHDDDDGSHRGGGGDQFDLTADELQELELENRALEEKLNSELEEAHKIESTAHEVSELIALFSSKVLDQHHVIGNLYDDSLYAVDTIREVPKELHKTAENSKGYRRYMLGFFLFLGCFLLWLDYINS